MGDTLLSDLLKPCLITAYDIRRRRAHFFNQVDAKQKGDSHNYYLRDIARATSAAPTYFECCRLKSLANITYPLVDGGLFANNPTLCAYAEARTMKVPKVRGVQMPKTWTAKDMHILSLGTGSVKKSYPYADAKAWGLVQWIKPVIDIQMSAVAETVDFQLRMVYDAVDAPDQYLRINCDLPDYIDSDMDGASLENMRRLRELGADLAESNAGKIASFIEASA